MIAALDREEAAAASMEHRRLERDLPRLASAGGSEAALEARRCDLDQRPRQLFPWRVTMTGIDVGRPVEITQRPLKFGPGPAEIADAPTAMEVDRTAPALAEDSAALGPNDFERRGAL